MKTIVALIGAVFTAYYGYSQTNTFPQNGNVGIGTTSPQSELDVIGEVHSTNSGSSLYWAYIKANWSQNDVFELGLSGHKLLTSDNYYFGSALNFWTADVRRMVINSDGNVGIGALNPTEKLHVDGGIRLNGNLTFSADQTAFFIKGPGNGGAIRLRTNIGASVDRNVQFGNVDNNGTWTSYMFVASNVGIGTTVPDERLAVKGKIHAEEVRVDLSVPGPDYVFKGDYKLKSLAEVETYTKENSHLPGVPSAKEMSEKGIQVGEMNMLLLKKVEELTLYIIQQEKRIQSLENKLPK